MENELIRISDDEPGILMDIQETGRECRSCDHDIAYHRPEGCYFVVAGDCCECKQSNWEREDAHMLAVDRASLAESFVKLAKEAAAKQQSLKMRCAKCERFIDVPPDFKPGMGYLCGQCGESQHYRQLLRPRTVYSGKVPYVNPKRQEKKAAKRRNAREARFS